MAGRALLNAGEVFAQTGVIQPNGSALHDAVVGGGMGAFGEPTAAQLEAVVATLGEADAALAAARFTDADGSANRRGLRQAVALARHGAHRLARTHGLPAPDDASLVADFQAVREEQAATWLERSRPGGLEDSLAKLDAKARRDGLL